MKINAKYSISPQHILLAEDDKLNQKVTLLMLKRLGYKADVASNGVEVLEALGRQKYDLVLMNIGMPKLDGIETTRKIRRRWRNSLKIIAITAYVLPGIRAICLEAGMDDYIGKPIKIDELARILGKYPLSQIGS
jgi:CheY-like chemotaxis protein